MLELLEIDVDLILIIPNNHIDYSIYTKQYLNLNIVCIQFACLLNHAPPHLCFLTATSRTCRSETPVAYLGLPLLYHAVSSFCIGVS